MRYPPSIKNHEYLRSLYVDRRMSSQEIGRLLSINGRLIRTWLKKYGIPLRNHVEAGTISAVRYLQTKSKSTCCTCGKEIAIHLYRTVRSKKLYCSRECQIKDCSDSLRKAYLKRIEGHPRSTKICPVCNKVFTVPFSHKKRKYCCDRCKGLAQILSLAGKKGPNHIETQVKNAIIGMSLEFEYNGNGELGTVINGMIPDFVNINGKKQVIEVFGDYYHGELAKRWHQSELGRIMAFNSVGYDCLILWERDIKSHTEVEIGEIISKFSNQKHDASQRRSTMKRR